MSGGGIQATNTLTTKQIASFLNRPVSDVKLLFNSSQITFLQFCKIVYIINTDDEDFNSEYLNNA